MSNENLNIASYSYAWLDRRQSYLFLKYFVSNIGAALVTKRNAAGAFYRVFVMRVCSVVCCHVRIEGVRMSIDRDSVYGCHDDYFFSFSKHHRQKHLLISRAFIFHHIHGVHIVRAFFLLQRAWVILRFLPSAAATMPRGYPDITMVFVCFGGTGISHPR